VFCSIEEGDEPFTFEWSKNGQTIRPGPGIKYRIESSQRCSTLSVDKIDITHGGNYSCRVKNGHGSDVISVSLNVKGTFYFLTSVFD